MSPENINDYADCAAIILAFAFPFIRAGLRAKKHISPLFLSSNIKHDVANGLLLPYFILIVISLIFKDAVHIDKHAMILAGIYGIIMVLMDLISGRDPCKRDRKDDKNTNNQ